MNKYLKNLLVGLTIFAPLTVVHAGTNDWSMVGAACTPTGQTTAAQSIFNSAGDVKFAASKIGEIIVTCPVDAQLRRAGYFNISYRDTDGAGTGARVVASLRRKNLVTGEAVTIGESFDSNTHPVVTSYALSWAAITPCEGARNFDYSQYAYYVQVNITRTATNQEPIFGGVHMDTTNLVC